MGLILRLGLDFGAWVCVGIRVGVRVRLGLMLGLGFGAWVRVGIDVGVRANAIVGWVLGLEFLVLGLGLGS